MRMDYETYHLERIDDHILVVMMDRPEVRNAKNTKMGLEQMKSSRACIRRPMACASSS